MPRKKKETTVMTEDIPQAEPVEVPTATLLLDPPADGTQPVPVEAVPVPLPCPTPTAAASNGQRRPAASWKFPAAAGVTIEIALWPHTITLQSGETIEVLNATITRSYKDAQGNWQKGGSYRIAELSVLRHAIEVAHSYALNAREMNCPI